MIDGDKLKTIEAVVDFFVAGCVVGLTYAAILYGLGWLFNL